MIIVNEIDIMEVLEIMEDMAYTPSEILFRLEDTLKGLKFKIDTEYGDRIILIGKDTVK